MRIIIAGSRNFSDYELLNEECNKIFKQLSDEGLLSGKVNQDILNMEIVCGKATGADTLGEMFAKEYNIKVKYFPANWEEFGKSAGYIRNEQMAKYAKEDNGILIAFWDGQSRGTKHMIDLANRYGLKVFTILF